MWRLDRDDLPFQDAQACRRPMKTVTLGHDLHGSRGRVASIDVVKPALCAWATTQRQTGGGAVESAQRATVRRPVVEPSERGARHLGSLYWSTVERSTAGIVRVRATAEGHELRVLGRGPVLLSFRTCEVSAANGAIECRYPIAGGCLARVPAGALTLAQRANGSTELSSVITGFVPRLAARPGRPHWTGALYGHVQARVHVAISRRYFISLARQCR